MDLIKNARISINKNSEYYSLDLTEPVFLNKTKQINLHDFIRDDDNINLLDKSYGMSYSHDPNSCSNCSHVDLTGRNFCHLHKAAVKPYFKCDKHIT